MRAIVSPAPASFTLRGHRVDIERLEANRWLVRVDGERYASFCSESRARAAGRSEARRRDNLAIGPHGSR